MHGKRSFVILLLLAAGLGGYVYFYEMGRDPSAVEPPKRDRVFTASSESFTEVEVRAASGETTTLKKNNGVWEITAPEAMPTDSTEIGGLLSTLESLDVQGVVDDNPTAVAPFGLEPPRIAVAFRTDAGRQRLLVGKKTPTGTDLYARVEGQPRVFLISAYLEDSLNKTPFGFRDKTILKFERDAADLLTIDRTGATTLGFAKKGSDWRLAKPYDAKADFNLVDGIVARLQGARMSAMVAADGTKELKKYGLDKPQASATIGAGSTRATLVIGGKKDDSSLYARDLSRPMVFTVDAALLEELKKTPDDFRKKDLFEFRAFSALGVDVTIGGRSHTFEKQTAPAPTAAPGATPPPAPTETWKQTKPDARDIDQSKITDLLTTMSNLKADTFTDKPLTSGEELTFGVRFGEPSKPTGESIRFRKSGSVVHAFLPGDSGAAVVPAAEFDKALALLKEIVGIK